MLLKIYLLLLPFVLVLSMDNLQVAYEWKILDYHYPNEMARKNAITSKKFIPENNLPLGLEVYMDRLFLTVPRWKSGVASSLNYINLKSEDSNKSPKLHPYPNWEAHNLDVNVDFPGIVSPFRVRADQCGRLWFIDTGIEDLLNDTKVLAPPRLQIYDLHNDALLRIYNVPLDQVKSNSFFANIAVDDTDCEDPFIYFSDLGDPGLIVYNWKMNRSWRIHHHYFHIDPLQGEFNVAGLEFQWTDHLFALALSKPDPQTGYPTLYFHPMTSTSEFSVNTKYLRNEELATNSSTDLYRKFHHLGTRGPKGQSGASFLHQRTDVLFYSLVNLNAIACWRITNPIMYTMESQGRIFMNNITMLFPNDIKVDANDNLWVLSDRLPIFMYSTLNYDEVNFRIMTASVQDAIRGTACDSKLIIGKSKPHLAISRELNPQQRQYQETNQSQRTYGSILLIIINVAMMMIGK